MFHHLRHRWQPIALLFLVSIFFPISASAFDQASVDKVYQYLGEKWAYYDVNGKKIRLQSLAKHSGSSGGDIVADGVRLNPMDVYDASGRNVVNPSIHSHAKPLVIIGREAGVLRGITEAHNAKRRITAAGLPALIWDQEIANYAQRWANHLKDQGCRMQHRRGKDRYRPYGENIAWADHQSLEPDDVVAMWYSEIKDYDYSQNRCSGVCGHYTQVVWRDSKRLGCGMASCGKSQVWVCNYDPAGNWVGERPY